MRKFCDKFSPFLFFISIFSKTVGCGIRDKEKLWDKVVRIIISDLFKEMMMESELAKGKSSDD
jgi:hypothetical protein